MTAFDRMDRVLHADRNMSVPADYRPGGRGAGIPVRIIRSEASDIATPFGRPIRTTQGTSISVLASDGKPAANDTWTLADGTILTALDVDRSETGTGYIVTVRS